MALKLRFSISIIAFYGPKIKVDWSLYNPQIQGQPHCCLLYIQHICEGYSVSINFRMFKSYPQSSVEFSDEENKVMEIIEERNNIMAINLQSRTAEQNKELKEYMNKLNTEYKKAYTGLLKKVEILKMK